MMNSTFIHWLDIFLDEKNLPYVAWEIIDRAGTTHFINSDVVIETIINSSTEDQRKIKNIIVQIDFHNSDVNHFFRHLAQGMVDEYEREVS